MFILLKVYGILATYTIVLDHKATYFLIAFMLFLLVVVLYASGEK